MRIVCWNEGDKARDICAPMIIECVEVGYNEDNETVYFRDSEGYEFESIEKVDVNTYKHYVLDKLFECGFYRFDIEFKMLEEEEAKENGGV